MIINRKNEDETSEISLKQDLSGLDISWKQLEACKALCGDDTTIPILRWDTFQVKSILGAGSFASVYEVQQGSGTDATHVQHTSTNKRFALKIIREDTSMLNSTLVQKSAIDIAIEAYLLAQLNHENVIQFHGILSNECSPKDYTLPERSQQTFSLLLEVLDDNLLTRLNKWRSFQQTTRKRRSMRFLRIFSDHSIKETSRSWHATPRANMDPEIAGPPTLETRLSTIVKGVAMGMAYIHSKDIVLRDLKPENIGFDFNGTIKIFDLGLARPLKMCTDGLEIAGSYRYMAPENMKCWTSGRPADVYSFGLMVWEILTLERPYQIFFPPNKKFKHCLDRFQDQVVSKQWRHSVDQIECQRTQQLIQGCWHEDPFLRPTFDRILLKLQGILSNRPRYDRKRSFSDPTLGFRSSLSK